MKFYYRVLICCFLAWFCTAVVECHGDLLDADGNALKVGILADKDRPEKGIIKATTIQDDSLVKSNSGDMLNDTGYEVSIENCDCGNSSFSCKFVNDEKKCDCMRGYAQKDGVCTECECGKESYRCQFEKGEKVCDCNINFVQKYGVCIDAREVCESDFPNCTTTGGYCNIEDKEESKKPAVQCFCPDKSVYEASEGCTVKDEDCNTFFPKCMDTGGKCNLDPYGRKVRCECPVKRAYKKGVGCKDCDCGYARGCSIDGDTKVCDCFENWLQNEGRCDVCYCGANGSVSCHYHNGEQICECKEGFSDAYGICMVDNCYVKCGINSREVHDEVECEGPSFAEVDCICRDNHKQFDPDMRKCRDDNCYEKCGINYGKEYYEVECKGGPFGEVNCTCLDEHKKFDPGMRKCRDWECEEVCGLENDVTCDHKGNNTLCLCDEGKQFDLEIKKCSQTQSGLSASGIAGIVVSIVGILLLAAAVLYYLKYYKKSEIQRNVEDHRISSENTLNMTSSPNRQF